MRINLSSFAILRPIKNATNPNPAKVNVIPMRPSIALPEKGPLTIKIANIAEIMGIDFRIINPKEQYAKEEAFKEANRIMKS